MEAAPSSRMTPLIITKGRARLYFDPDTAFLRLDHDGAGLCIDLSDRPEELMALSGVSLAAARKIKRAH